jgi:peptidoglycan hydrolase-like protein with peptidoglycan-binding domain
MSTATVNTSKNGTGGTLNFRQTKNGTVLGAIPNGTSINVVRADSGWFTLVYGGQPGYVQVQHVDGGPTTVGDGLAVNDTALVNSTNVNIRSGAGTSSSSVGTISRPSAVTIYGKQSASDGYWYRINSSAQQWVRGDFLAPNGAASGGGSGGSGGSGGGTGTTWRTTLRNGDSGDDVNAMQTLLNTLRYDCGTPDGAFGSRTEWAVRYFQYKNNLTVDGVAGPNTQNRMKSSSPTQGITSTIINWSANQKPQQYLMWDSLWTNYPYDANNTSTVEKMGDSGCGPTAIAMVASTFCQKAVLPPVLGDLAIANGYRDHNGVNGTYPSFYQFVATRYGLQRSTTTSLTTVKSYCDGGGLAVINVTSASPYTNYGHYVVIYKIDSNNTVYVADPNSSNPSTGTVSQWNNGWFQGTIYLFKA